MSSRPVVGNRRVLIIDDNENIHSDFRSILCPVEQDAALEAAEAALFGTSSLPVREGFEIDSAYQGEQALGMVIRAADAGIPYAVAFVDMRMPPGWDGVETITRMWERDPKLQIAICTAYSEYSWSDMAERLRLDDRLLILKKPFDNIEIFQMASALTAKWWMEHEWDRKMNRLEQAVEERTRELMRANAALQQEMLERRHLEGQILLAQKMESIGQLAAGIAHEINTPIQYIGDSVIFLQSAFEGLNELRQCYAHALDAAFGGAEPAQVRATIAAAESSADLEFQTEETPRAFERTLEGVARVTKIVRAMKDFSHQDQEEFSSADINQAIESTIEVARSEYKYIATVETRLQSLPLVICDISTLKQVFLNMIINAAHAIGRSGKDAGTGRICITTSTTGDTVVISIEDNGCGIPTAISGRIYDPFFTTKEVGKGSGQGLAIAHRIVVTKHGGHIEFASEVDRGTTFFIHVPVSRPKLEQIA